MKANFFDISEIDESFKFLMARHRSVPLDSAYFQAYTKLFSFRLWFRFHFAKGKSIAEWLNRPFFLFKITPILQIILKYWPLHLNFSWQNECFESTSEDCSNAKKQLVTLTKQSIFAVQVLFSGLSVSDMAASCLCTSGFFLLTNTTIVDVEQSQENEPNFNGMFSSINNSSPKRTKCDKQE